MNASNAYGSNAQGNNAQGSTASGVATRLSDITAGAETVAAFRAIRQPSLGAVLIVPERAMAGQSVTISVYDAKRNPESSVELVLNGNTMVTNIDGQISFTIPDDATPGRSLNVGLAARPEITPVTVEVLQPLVIPAEKQQPSIERMTLTGSRSAVWLRITRFPSMAVYKGASRQPPQCSCVSVSLSTFLGAGT
jgi:hypothetical protein